jgi:hypothetical protein
MNNTALQTTESQPHLSIVPADVSAGALQAALAGDLARLPESDRLKFYGKLCEFTGLNPLSKPFDWLTFQGKLTLYANKGCAEQLRKIHKVNVDIVERRHEQGVYWVRAKFTDGDGRTDESIAAVPLPDNATGDARAMAMMKAETKAKRRGTFSICGLSLLVKRDDDIDGDAPRNVSHATTTSDKADALNAEIVEVSSADPKGELLGQIQGAIKSAVPGTDEGAKRAKADWMQKAFGVRSWTVIEAMPVEKLRDGLDKLTALLVQDSGGDRAGVDEPTVAETVPNAAPVPAATKPAPEPEEPPFDVVEEVEENVLPKETVAKLESILADCKTSALAWLVKQKWLTDEQGLKHLAKDKADKIIASPTQFVRAVTPKGVAK